jgi:hypothetical protein
MHPIIMNGWHRSFDPAPRRLPEARLEAEFTVPVRLRVWFPRPVRRGRLWCRLKWKQQEQNDEGRILCRKNRTLTIERN